MASTLVFASSNAGKVSEISALLATTSYNIAPQSQYDVDDVEETGLTFVENAIIKARHAAKHTGLPCIADDSGLEVDILNGAPGIYSARYAGIGSSDKQNVDKLLAALQDVPAQQRLARFQCLMVFMRHESDPTPIICQGTWQGSIALQQQGNNGFGYDPIFYVSEEQCTSAQLPSEVKNRLSHRGQALKKMVAALKDLNNSA